MNNGISSLKLLNQSIMDCQLSCTSQLSWILVIDTLARSNQVDISLLLDLLEKTPEISGNLGRNAREMLSLRIIERFSAQGALANPVSSPSSQRVRLDPSDRCEDVLRRILTETSSSHLKPAGPEMLKWDLQPFVERKRSNLPKWALQQLKGAILSGNHSCFASLKEQSGLPTGNQGDYEAPVDDSNRNGITPTDTNNDHFLPRDFSDENLVAVNRKRKATSESAGGKSSENDCETHVKSFKKQKCDIICNEQSVLSSGVDTQLEDMTVSMLHGEGTGCNGITPNDTDDDHFLPRDLPDEKLVEVNRKGKATSESAGGKSSENDCETCLKSFKEQKYDIICNEQSVGEVLISSDVDTQLADRTVAMQHCEGKGCSLGRKTHLGGMGLTGPDDNNEYTSLKGLVGTDEVLLREKQVPHCDTELNNKPEEEREQDHSIERPKGDKESFKSLEQASEGVDNFKGNILENVMNVHEVEEDNYLSSNSDGNNNDKTAIVRKDNASCFSQCAYSEDSLATNNRRDQYLLADSPKIHAGEERCMLGEKTHGEVMGQNGPGDCNNKSTSSKGHVVHNEVLTHEKQVQNCGTVVPNDKLDVEKRQDREADDAEGGFITSDKDMDKLEQLFCRNVPTVGEAEQDNDVLSDSDGYHGKRTSIDAKKKNFLSSQCTHSQDSLASTDCRALKHCVKCNKGGKLLVCSSNACPVVIHESCLDSDQRFDPDGIFYCPFCTYNRAISEYMEVKKKASLARKDLRNFICLKTQQESKKQSQRSCKENHLEQDDGLLNSNEQNKRDVVNVASNCQLRKKLEHGEAGPSEVRSLHSPPFGGQDVDSTNRIAVMLNEVNKDWKKTRQIPKSPKVDGQHQIAAPAIRKSRGENTSFHISETVGRSEKHAGIRSKKGVSCSPEKDLPGQCQYSQSTRSADVDEISKETNDGASKYFIRVQKPNMKTSYPAIPQLRRKRLPWTSEEEEALKKLMREHYDPRDEIIPWQKIWKSGAGVFERRRSAMDLRDKWRNMCKAAPKFN